jgi:hypothetical protein
MTFLERLVSEAQAIYMFSTARMESKVGGVQGGSEDVSRKTIHGFEAMSEPFL